MQTPSVRQGLPRAKAVAAAAALGLITLLSLPGQARAELSFNASLVSDYRYRGISQTRLQPALQGGVDYRHGGFYVGAWASSIRWVRDVPGGGARGELDLYAGYKGELTRGLGYDVGVLTYVYPRNRLSPSANTTEVYAALSHGPATLKLSHALTHTFGNPDSRHSVYVDLSAAFDLGGGLMLSPHIGHQKINGPVGDAASYSDASLTLSKDFNGLVPSLALVATDADKAFYVPGARADSRRFLGRTALVLGLKWVF